MNLLTHYQAVLSPMTTSMVPILLGLGFFGFLGLSILCPLLALSGYYLARKNAEEKSFLELKESSAPLRIEIIIPAHNEAELIRETITNIQQSIQRLQSHPQILSVPQISIHVGADGCTDNSASMARQFRGVLVTEFPENIGKWATLKVLINESVADWVILVDSGTLWPENYLSDLVLRIRGTKSNVMAMAPSYRPLRASWLHQLLWRFETDLKHMEVLCGGPISLHGATVAYRTRYLKNALCSLGNTRWVNDDVVIPLTLRTLYPQGVILYPVGEVRDAGVELYQLDLGRRKRLLLGNLQWIRALLPSSLRHNPVAGMVAGRRIFRVLWGYWVAMIVLGLAMEFHFDVLPAIAAIGILTVSSGSFRQFGAAAIISLLAPFLLIRASKLESGDWE